jgi:hypothetical protein
MRNPALDGSLMATERRRDPRIPVRRRVRIEIEDFEGEITLLDISPGGFGISTSELVSGDARKVVRFLAQDGRWVLTLAAKVVHMRLCEDKEKGGPLYLVGLAFTDLQEPAVNRVVDQLLERIAGVLV